MGINNKDISGVYLVIDPAMDQTELLDKVEQSLKGGVEVLQIWNHWPQGMSGPDKEQLITFILEMAANFNVPVLINEEWELLKTTSLDGVHFDTVPENYQKIKEEIDRDFIAGLTCSNQLEKVRWADENGMDYISFCAMFPSPSVNSCEIVQPETVKRAREITDLPLFLSGGITPENIADLKELEFNGLAVISGILQTGVPARRTAQYKQALKEHEQRRNN